MYLGFIFERVGSFFKESSTPTDGPSSHGLDFRFFGAAYYEKKMLDSWSSNFH